MNKRKNKKIAKRGYIYHYDDFNRKFQDFCNNNNIPVDDMNLKLFLVIQDIQRDIQRICKSSKNIYDFSKKNDRLKFFTIDSLLDTCLVKDESCNKMISIDINIK